MASTQKTKTKVPRFKSLEEEAKFWETHDTTEFEDEFQEVQVKATRPLTHTLAVRLDAATLHRLATAARRKGIGPSTLARMWLLERLDQGELETKLGRQMQRVGVYGLTSRELAVLQLMTEGRSDKEIGTLLGINEVTVSKHVENIRAKMRAAFRTEAGVRARREELLD